MPARSVVFFAKTIIDLKSTDKKQEGISHE